MLAPRRLLLCACAPLALFVASLVTARRAAAQAPGSLDISESIDDPKVERRLGMRIELPGGGAPATPPQEAASVAPTGDVTFASPPPQADAIATPVPPAAGAAPRVPHLKLAYRWLPFAQLKPGGVPGRGPDETFHVVSL